MKILQSSKNTGDISLTVKGILVGLAPIAISLMALAGVEIAQDNYMEVVENIGAVISATMILLGVLRKLYFSVKEFIN